MSPKRIFPRVLVVAAAFLVAATGKPRADGNWSSWTAIWENDTFAFPTGSDEFYTNGIRLTVARSPAARWHWAKDVGEAWARVTRVNGLEVGTSLAIGQNLYTPEIITTFEPDPLDRPYAAWLYGGVRIDIQGPKSPVAQGIEFDVGVIGPPALGEQTQSGVHALRHNRIPKGWSHQIPTEIAVSAYYDVRRRFRRGPADAVIGGGLMLGTVQVYPTAGLTVRLGRHISGMPVAIVAPSAGRNAPESTNQDAPGTGDGGVPAAKVEWYGFAGIDGRCVLYNVFLDGNLVGGPPSVNSEPWVYDLRFGASLRIASWRFTYTFVRRGEEFTPPPGRAEGLHDFGSFAVTYEQPRP